MPWKPEYAERRRERAATDSEYRVKRNAQGNGADRDKRRDYNRQWNFANKERVAAVRRENAEERNRQRRERYAQDEAFREKAKNSARQRCPNARRDARLRAEFGISSADYDRMLEQQHGGCAICAKPFAGKGGQRLAVDHCHGTGAVRGLLCTNCNQGLGKFADDAERLRRAADYLNRSRLVGGLV